MIPALEALERLRDGNQRFIEGVSGRNARRDPERRVNLVDGQEPFAIVLGCSDSRVPVELLFDQGLGDLFVVRVAGNVVGDAELGSVELAVLLLGVKLVVVLGHTRCGLIGAAVEDARHPGNAATPAMESLLARVRAPVEQALAGRREAGAEEITELAVRANVDASVRALRHGSKLLERKVREDGLVIAGGVYSLETGSVETRDGPLSD